MNNLMKCLSTDPDLAQIPQCDRPRAMQTLYIARGCDYTSFFRGLGKVSFFQHATFIAGQSETTLLGSIGRVSVRVSVDNMRSNAYLSFLWLIVCASFRKHTSAFHLEKHCFTPSLQLGMPLSNTPNG